MQPNVNPDTGVRYGIISANSLYSDIIDRIQAEGKDVHFEEAQQDLENGIREACKDYLNRHAIQYVVDIAIENFGDDWYDDEPVHEFEIDGVKGRTIWIGGALHVWVFESKWMTNTRLCSPCVPNCGDLDAAGDYQCYDVPKNWRDNEQS